MTDSHPGGQKGKSQDCLPDLAPVPPGRLSLSPCDPLSPILSAPAGRPFVVAQLGQSLDGRIATVTGESRWINGDGALDHLHRLRAAVDAVLVGVGTVIADDPRLDVRRVDGPNPARVVIDPRGRMPPDCRCLDANGARRVLVRCEPGPVLPGCEEVLVEGRDGVIPPAAILQALFARGLRRILVEGGARTVSTFIDAACVDRLHVLVAPLLIGSGQAGLDLAPVGALASAARPVTGVHVLGGSDVLFDCDLRGSREGSE